MEGSTAATLVILALVVMAGGYAVSWRWLNGRFGYAMDGKYHIVLFIFFAPFVIAIIGVIYLITMIKDKSTGTKGGKLNDLDI